MNTPPSTDDLAVNAASTPATTGIMLSPEDVQRLLRDDSPDSRASILEKVAHEYNAQRLSARESEIAEHIFRLLMRDLSLRVRETLAERVKDNPGIPRDIALHMAEDVESVAVPVLKASAVLSDADLVRIVEQTHDMGKLLAITQREQVSPRVSGALVETNYEQVVTSLLSNAAAEIGTQHLNRIADAYEREPHILEQLTQRPNLPLPLVERLIEKASETVAAELRVKYNLSDQALKENTERMREAFMLRLLEGELPKGEVEALVAQLAAGGHLNASLLMTALCRGQLFFFTAGIAYVAQLPLANAEKLVADRGPLGFRGLYEKAGLPESMYEAVHLVVRGVQDLQGGDAVPGALLYANRLVERVLYEAGDRSIEYLPYFIAMIRQHVPRK